MEFMKILAVIVLLIPIVAVAFIIYGLKKAYEKSKYDLVGELKDENKLKSYFSRWPKTICLVLPLAVGMLTPSLIIFIIMHFAGGYDIFTATHNVLIGQFKPGENYFLLSVISTVPFACLSVAVRNILIKKTLRATWCICVCGLIGILSLMIPAHVSVWYPLYSGNHMSSTSVVAFVSIPMYCLAAGSIGVLIGWLIALLPWFKNESDLEVN
jgi:hypothetical protein